MFKRNCGKIAAIALAATMTLSMAGCGKDKVDPADTQAQMSTQTTTGNNASTGKVSGGTTNSNTTAGGNSSASKSGANAGGNNSSSKSSAHAGGNANHPSRNGGKNKPGKVIVQGNNTNAKNNTVKNNSSTDNSRDTTINDNRKTIKKEYNTKNYYVNNNTKNEKNVTNKSETTQVVQNKEYIYNDVDVRDETVTYDTDVDVARDTDVTNNTTNTDVDLTQDTDPTYNTDEPAYQGENEFGNENSGSEDEDSFEDDIQGSEDEDNFEDDILGSEGENGETDTEASSDPYAGLVDISTEEMISALIDGYWITGMHQAAILDFESDGRVYDAGIAIYENGEWTYQLFENTEIGTYSVDGAVLTLNISGEMTFKYLDAANGYEALETDGARESWSEVVEKMGYFRDKFFYDTAYCGDDSVSGLCCLVRVGEIRSTNEESVTDMPAEDNDQDYEPQYDDVQEYDDSQEYDDGQNYDDAGDSYDDEMEWDESDDELAYAE